MGFLPVPGEVYLNDFPDKMPYSITRNNQPICVADGLTNKDEDGKHIAFLYGIDIQVGDIIKAPDGKSYVVNAIAIDTYAGKPSIIKACY